MSKEKIQQIISYSNKLLICTFFFVREKDFIQERESLLQQQNERDQQYNALVKSLKDRVSILIFLFFF